jgi:acyl transferase domain-containing protein
MALAGGVRIVVPARQGYLHEVGGLAPDDGHTRSFDAGANGSVLGHGVAVVLLKRLAEALADGDPIRAVIKGSAINNDGSLKAGYTAPSIGGQAAAVEAALAAAGVPADSIGYLEAHGSATELGDPIEIAALTRAFRAHTERRGFCRIGSLKSNFGHLDRAAGAAGLIKAVLALEREQIPPTINFARPNPKIDFDSSPFRVNDRLTPWPRSPRSPRLPLGPLGPPGAAPRRAAVNSLGMGGTNVHLILEEAPEEVPSGAARPWHLLPLSARTATALDAVTRNLGEHLERHPGLSLADAAYTLQVGRKPLAHRRFAVCRDSAEAAGLLSGGDPRRLLGGWCFGRERPVVFLFAGLGGQYVDMGRGLYDAEPAFRAEIDRCAELLLPHLSLDLRQVLYPPVPVREQGGAAGASGGIPAAGDLGVVSTPGASGAARTAGGPSVVSTAGAPATLATPGVPGAVPNTAAAAGADAAGPAATVATNGSSGGLDLRQMLGRSAGAPAASPLDSTRLVQPALFVVEYALARLWMSWGVVPEAMAGYSIGEYVAACLAGVLTLEDALHLVAGRARLIDELPAGAMLAAGLGESDLTPLLGPELSLAATNGPEQSVAAGPEAAVAALEEELARRGIASRRLQARHAFHSRMMEPLFDRLVELTAGVERRAPAIPYLSNLTGGWMTADLAADPVYWARHACGTVRFSQAVAELARVPERVLLEIGPGQTLSSLVLQHPAAPGRGEGGEPAVAASLPHAYERQDDLACLLTALGKLWTLGVPIDWQRFHAGERRRRVNLPTYPFERERYWIDTRAPGAGSAAAPAPPAVAGAAAAPPVVGSYPRPSLRVEYVEPRTELERAIADAWSQLLGVAQVGLHDSFLDLGGDSLLASRMVTRLREVVHVEIPIRQVFETPTVGDLAAAVEQLRRQTEEREVEALLAQIRGLSDEDLELEILRREGGPVQEEAR